MDWVRLLWNGCNFNHLSHETATRRALVRAYAKTGERSHNLVDPRAFPRGSRVAALSQWEAALWTYGHGPRYVRSAAPSFLTKFIQIHETTTVPEEPHPNGLAIEH